MALTTYAANKIFDHMFRNQSYTPPSTLYIGLFTSAPTDAYTGASPTGTEVSGGSYARIACALSAASSRATSNSSNLTFPTATASWGTVVAIGLFEASSGGEMLWWDGLEVNKTVGSGDTFQINSGDLDMAFSASS